MAARPAAILLVAASAAITVAILTRRELKRRWQRQRLISVGSARLTAQDSSQRTCSSSSSEWLNVSATAVPFPLLPITKPVTLKACASLPMDRPTVFICSYPKSGTTWMQNIVYELATRGRRPLDHISKYCPFFENDKSWVHTSGGQFSVAPFHSGAHDEIGVRIFNTHLLWHMMPGTEHGDRTARAAADRTGSDRRRGKVSQVQEQDCARYIYLVRSPKDVCASFYHHLSHQAPEDGGYAGSIDAFVRDWCAGECHFGRWTDHLLSWLKPGPRFHDVRAAPSTTVGRDSRVLVLSYEFLQQDLRAACRAVALHCKLEVSEDELEELLPRLSFDHMKANLPKFAPTSVSWIDKGDGFEFVRNGRVGDGNAAFSGDHADRHFRALLGNNGERVPACCRGLL